MITKLTLTMNDAVIDKAKEYARRKSVSLSRLIEFYLASLSSSPAEDTFVLPPITNELSGMVKTTQKIDERSILESALIEKYL